MSSLEHLSIIMDQSGHAKATAPSATVTAAAQSLVAWRQSVWSWVCWSGAKTFDTLDFAGEVVANFLGLNTSKYQWMIDMHERELEDRQQRRLEARQRRQLRLQELLEHEQKQLQALETGASDDELDLALSF